MASFEPACQPIAIIRVILARVMNSSAVMREFTCVAVSDTATHHSCDRMRSQLHSALAFRDPPIPSLCPASSEIDPLLLYGHDNARNGHDDARITTAQRVAPQTF